MAKIIRTPYANCTSDNPSTCRYHGVRFAKDPKLAQYSSMADFFFKTEHLIEASSTLDVEQDDTWDFVRTAQELSDKLTLPERQALHLYCDEHGSKVIAWYLNGTIENHHRESREDVMARVALLDSVIAKHPVPEKSRVLYRGLKSFNNDFPDMQVGGEVNFKSFSSTSASLDVAKDFADKDTPIVLQITTRQGAPVHSGFLEHEYLLPRDMKFRITRIEENVLINGSHNRSVDGVTLISLEEVS